MTPHKYADVIKAWADGATVQGRNLSSMHADRRTWCDFAPPGSDTDQPAWCDEFEWRVKPANVVRWCPVITLPAGSIVIGEGKTSKLAATSEPNAPAYEKLVGLLRIEINAEEMYLASVSLEKP